jgi:hypothetical protein
MKAMTFSLKSFLVWLVFDEGMGEWQREEWVCSNVIDPR